MTTLRIRLLAAIALTSATPALAKSDTQYWQTLQVTAQVSPNIIISNEAIFRSGDARGFYEIENNLMAGYRFGKHVNAYLGYTANALYQQGNYTTMEHRFRQQVSFYNYAILGKVRLSGRLRLEERWRGGFAGTAWRLRPQARLSVPVHGKTTLHIVHESFVGLNTTGFQKASGLERMRNSISLRRPIAEHFSLEFGYLEQHGFVPRGEDTDDHVATIQLSATF